MQANILPSPSQVISLCKSCNKQKLRLYGSNPAVLAALRNSDIGIILGADEQDLQQLSWNPAIVGGWVQANIVPYVGSVNFQYIVMGNEEIPSRPAPSLATSFPPYTTLPAPCRPLASPFRSVLGNTAGRRVKNEPPAAFAPFPAARLEKRPKKFRLRSSHLPPPIQTLCFHPPDQPATAEPNEALVSTKHSSEQKEWSCKTTISGTETYLMPWWIW
ncbi:Glucan endo-1,3-beta-glucosidase, acidic isoform [Platanthera guangdongensis]|uniref:Glucan endo-1,3-beta-glucosidase, acidic isoform n=1 Tax=Platanthera guangdongensis TaxID=2320717 RepID=A0ABR2M7Q7_9ASPA